MANGEDAVGTPTSDQIPADPMLATPMPVTPMPATPMPVEGDSSLMLLLSVLLPLAIAIYLLFGRKLNAGRGRSLLLFGPVGGGKSALYCRLKQGRIMPTVSSMEPATASFVLHGTNGSPVRVCDMPGSGRLRESLKEEAARSAALVCVLDGTQLAAQVREAAGMIFDVFSHDTVAQRPPALLVVVNKLDTAGCATPAAARKALEQEVQRVRLARTTMRDTSGSSRQVRGIADDTAAAFTFDQLGSECVFGTISVTKPSVEPVLAFAQKHAN